MTNLLNKVCLPIVLFGAINYGLVGLFRLDLISYLGCPLLIRAAHIIIGLAGLGLITGWFGKK